VTDVQIFLLGFGGSWAAEVILLYQIYQREAPFPSRYGKVGFWVVRFLVAVIGGGLAVFYKLTDPIPAGSRNSGRSLSGNSGRSQTALRSRSSRALRKTTAPRRGKGDRSHDSA